MNTLTRSALAIVTAVGLTSGLAACSTASDSGSQSSNSQDASASTMASKVTISDAWVKAIDDVSGVMPMTGIFMLVTNDGDEDVTIVGGSVDAELSADPLETHEVVKNDVGEMVMQEASSGVVVPAHGSVKLMPGSYHLMMFNMMTPIPAGETLTFTVEFADGSTSEVVATSYSIENGTEKYAPEAK